MTTWTNISGGSAISESLADQAATSATNAANSASAASTSAAAAAAAKTAAEAAQVASETAETNSATSASQSASSATNSATSASQSASSATSSAASAAAALVSEGNAATSEASAQAADTSATAASASSAASAVTAAAEAAAALASQNSATSSASAANTSATNAANSAVASAASASSAAADLATFQNQYHGASGTAPTTGLDVGDLWFDTSGSGVMKVYDGSSWVAAYISASGMLAAANNLSDLASSAAARTNLGLGTMATQAATSVDIDGGTIDGVTIGGTSAGAVTATSLSVTDASVVSVSSSSDALRITQTGAGNALKVEDSANPDGTPFVVDATGTLVSGATSSYVYAGSAVPPRIQVQSVGGGDSTINATSWATGVNTHARLMLARSEGGVVGTHTVVDNGDNLGQISFQGSDGTSFVEAATISVYSDNVAGASDMPGRLVFSTTADGASSPTERLRVDSSGRVGIGRTPTTNKLEVAGTIESTSGGYKFPDGSTQSSAGATTGKAIAMAIVFGG